MNWKKFVLFGCAIACVFAVSPATAQMRRHGGSIGRMGMHGGFTPRSMGRMPMHRPPMGGSMGRMPMQRTPTLNSAPGFRRFNDGRFVRDDRFHQFNRFNDGDFDRDDRFHRFNHFNETTFIGSFGFPWWWGWGWGRWWGWGGYPYGYYSDYNYGGYGSGYGNGYSDHANIADLQDKLANAGYYHGQIDGIFGPRTRSALRAYRHDHSNGNGNNNYGGSPTLRDHPYSPPPITTEPSPTY